MFLWMKLKSGTIFGVLKVESLKLNLKFIKTNYEKFIFNIYGSSFTNFLHRNR